MLDVRRRRNPPWIDKAITASWDDIESLAEYDIPPPVVKEQEGELHADELGCGNYGCVIETDNPRVVLKITSDPSEAAFVALLLDQEIDSPGIVTYYAVRRMPGKREGRPIYAIWREAAYEVGAYVKPGVEAPPDVLAFLMRLTRISDWAELVHAWMDKTRQPYTTLAKARSASLQQKASARIDYTADLEVTIRKSRTDPALNLATLLLGCRTEAELMAVEPVGPFVGSTMIDWLDKGILCADVHGGNVGLVDRDDQEGVMVITDPGHALFLKPWLQKRAQRLVPYRSNGRATNPVPFDVVP